MNRCIKYLSLTFLLFGIEFDVPIIAFITLRKLTFIMIFLLYVANKYRQNSIRILRGTIVESLSIIGLFFYTIIIVNEISKTSTYIGVYQPKNLIILLLYIVILPIILSTLYKNVSEFAQCQWYVTLFQSTIVLLGRIFLPFRRFIFFRFSYDDGRLLEGIENGIRSVGINLSGSSGSMILLVGLICGIYLFYHSHIKRKKRILFEYMIVMASLLFVGRAGLYLGVIGITIVYIDCISRRDPSAKLIIELAIVTISAVLVYIFLSPDSWGLRMWIRWVTEFSNLFGEGSAITVIRSMNIPPLTIETFFGTGMIYGITPSGLILNHDAGYVRMYTAIGLVGCVAYYGIIYGYYLSIVNKVKNKTDKRIYLFFLFAIIIGEMKEPFLGKTPITIILSCILLLEMQQRSPKRKCFIDQCKGCEIRVKHE